MNLTTKTTQEQQTPFEDFYEQARRTIQTEIEKAKVTRKEKQIKEVQNQYSFSMPASSLSSTIISTSASGMDTYRSAIYDAAPDSFPKAAPSMFIASHGLNIHKDQLKELSDEQLTSLNPPRSYGESDDSFAEKRANIIDELFEIRDSLRHEEEIDKIMTSLDEPFQKEGETPKESKPSMWHQYEYKSLDSLYTPSISPLDALRGTKPKSRSRGSVAINDEGKDIPSALVSEKTTKKAPARKTVKEEVKPPFLDDGYVLDGYRFSRNLMNGEYNLFCKLGYQQLIKMFPELKFVEKEKPLNEDEEVIVLLSELADSLAMDECSFLPNFNLKTHGADYQVAYKKYLTKISSFKRNKDG